MPPSSPPPTDPPDPPLLPTRYRHDTRAFDTIKRLSINKLLLLLGFPKKRLYPTQGKVTGYAPGNSCFWEREPDLYIVLREAYWYYREAAWTCHPDHGGATDDMERLNAIWHRIQELFARRGVRLAGARAIAPSSPPDPWQAGLSLKQAALWVNIPWWALRLAIRNGELPVVWKTGKEQWIRLTDLEAYAARKTPPHARV